MQQTIKKVQNYIFHNRKALYSKSIMERSLQNRYSNSQDQLIISLNQQIEAMLPLKESYAALQRYHIKLSNDYESLLSQQDHIAQAYTTKISELLVLNDELDAKKNRYIQQLRNLQNQKAKLTLDRKTLMSLSETLSSKFNLESSQCLLLKDRTRQILENCNKTEQSISTYKKIIAEIQAEIKLKTSQNLELQSQILKRTESNKALTKRIEATEDQIRAVGNQNQNTIGELKNLDKTQYDLELQIREALKRNRQLSQKIIGKKQELANLNHQKQYYTRLIQSELLIKQDLEISSTKLNNLLERKLKELDRVTKENGELQLKIKDQEETQEKSRSYKEALVTHLGELIKANTTLVQAMKRSCKQDQKAHQILNKKLQGLDLALIKTADIETVNSIKKSYILRQKTNELLSINKVAEKSGSTWINELTDLENRC